MKRIIYCISISLIILSGCATPGVSEFKYSTSLSNKVQNEKTVTKSFDEVWTQLIEGISKSFFVINNVEKVSGIINVSFHSDEPEDYIDCGKSTRTLEWKGNKEVFNYEIAEDSTYKLAGKNVGELEQFATIATVNRKTSLEGRFNVFVSSKGSQTTISTNARYVFTTKVSGEWVAYNAYDQVMNREAMPPEVFTTTFNTNVPNKGDENTPVCNSKGNLEAVILDLIRG